MNDEKKSPDTEQLDESFNEGFDFGEGETESHPVKTTTNKGSHKKIIGFIFLSVVVVILVMGYRIYRPKQLSSNNISAPKPTTQPVATVKVTPAKTLPKDAELEQSEAAEIAKALAGVTATPVPVETPTITPPISVPTPTATPTTAPASVPPAAPTIVSTPPETQALPSEAPVSETTKLQEGLNKLNTQIDSILSQIKYLDAYSREVSDNLNKLNESISTMDSRLLALTNTTSTLSKDIGSVKSEVGHVKAVLKEDGLDISPDLSVKEKQGHIEKEGRIAIVEPEYTVHAVVPGRAWLKSTKGQIVTVAEGDSIGNYGKILVIDAANGVVLTSSGVAFR